MKNLLFSSVGRKLLVGLTAVGVAGFILIHVGGNMLLFVGPEAFNRYSYHLTKTTALLYPAELCLGLLFAFHFFLTGWLTLDNWKARPIGPSTLAGKLKRASWASRTMIWSGLLVFAFLVLHVWAFRFGPHYEVTYDGIVMRDLFLLVNQSFRSPWFTGWYVLCLVLLWFHLNHGLSSFFQSLGLLSAKTPLLRRLANLISVLVIGGFIGQAVYLFLGGGH